jgi:hypothetical protein
MSRRVLRIKGHTSTSTTSLMPLSLRSIRLSVSAAACLGPQQRLVEAWGEIHREELQRDWDLLQSGQPPVKIEPLR